MNTKVTPQPAEGLVTVVLLKPHTDAGVEHAPGAELTLAPVLADWLVGIGSARLK